MVMAAALAPPAAQAKTDINVNPDCKPPPAMMSVAVGTSLAALQATVDALSKQLAAALTKFDIATFLYNDAMLDLKELILKKAAPAEITAQYKVVEAAYAERKAAQLAARALQQSLIQAEAALAAEMATVGITAGEIACYVAIAAGTAALAYECYDIYSSGTTYVGTGTGGWRDFIGEVRDGYGYYCPAWIRQAAPFALPAIVPPRLLYR